MRAAYDNPHFCDLVITESCMLKCRMCRMWQSKSGIDELPAETWKGFIDSFADFVGGNAQVQFVGGEPLLKNGIMGLIGHARGRGLATTMTTNAYLLDGKVSGDIALSGLNTLVLSLESLKAQVHDFLRGQAGVYARVMAALDFFDRYKGKRPRLHIVTTIMQPNLDGILELAEWAEGSRAVDAISFQALTQPFFTPPDEAWHKSEEFAPLWPKDAARIDEVLDGLIHRKKSGFKITNPAAQFEVFRSYFHDPGRFVKASRCNLGYDSLTVNTAGSIFLCNSMEPIGNIRDRVDIAELWSSEKAEWARRQIKDCRHNCKLMINCFFNDEE